MTEITLLTAKIDDCNMAIESLATLIEKHGLKPLVYAQTFIKQEKAKAAKALTTAKLDIVVKHEEAHY